jgi:hypothetical protein
MPMIKSQNRRLHPMIERIIAGDLPAQALWSRHSTPKNRGAEVGLR